MTPCFADTFFFLALVNSRDAFHSAAVQLNRVNRPIVTTAWVLLELADHLADAKNRALFGQVHRAIVADPRFEIIPAEQQMLDRGGVLYEDRADKDWSLTDCTSFLVMQDRQITEAFTGDRHFEQAGFKLLL
jgi:uncharacterized protein